MIYRLRLIFYFGPIVTQNFLWARPDRLVQKIFQGLFENFQSICMSSMMAGPDTGLEESPLLYDHEKTEMGLSALETATTRTP